MNQIKILALFPYERNGGISSWARKFLKTFPDSEFKLIPVDVAPLSHHRNNYVLRRIYGIIEMLKVRRSVARVIKKERPDILHTTTSGNIGSWRDYIIGKLCRRHNIKTILHCRYGCIAEDYVSKGFVGRLLRMAFRQYDQIWVLDEHSYNFLKKIPEYADKVYLTPNSIIVNTQLDNSPKSYERMAFIGNLIPTKGLYELVEAATKTNVRLDIIGPGSHDVIEKVKSIAGDKLSKTIFIHGRLANDEAVQFMKEVDMIALPTYYRSEAFPISILEAMSLSKLVVSCKRAAIPDILTALDGTPCGIMVEEKSSEAIVNAINWCQQNHELADEMRQKAYQKVYTKYRTEVVYDLYREYYRMLKFV